MARKQKTYSPALKARVIAAILSHDLTLAQIAKNHGVSVGTVKRWSAEDAKKVVEESVAAIEPNQSEPVRSPANRMERLGHAFIEYLEESVKGLTAQARIFSDEHYLREQTGSDLAQIHRTQAASVLEICAAIERGSANEPDGER